ncbi:MAG: hypothetical protein RSC06_08870 [Clostridia bacterium]
MRIKIGDMAKMLGVVPSTLPDSHQKETTAQFVACARWSLYG